MKISMISRCGIAAAAFAAFVTGLPGRLDAQQTTAQAVPIGNSDLGGVVTSANGPEAGVWVIAETSDLPTKFAKIVVTDDRGRYLIPDLPKAKYTVWVRGYGLVDSVKTQAEPGKIVDLKATPAPSPPGLPNIIRRSTGMRCSKSRTRACFPVPAPTACRSS